MTRRWILQINEEDLNPLSIVKLTDINPKFIEIENLFDEKDQEKFNIKNLEAKVNSVNKYHKNTSLSVTFKKIIQKEIWNKSKDQNYQINVVDKQTINNFKQVFEYLTNKINEIKPNKE